MAKFKSGNKKPANSGRKKGVQNKVTTTVKQALLDAFNELQNDAKCNLIAWAKKNPTAFYQLAAKLIPTEVQTRQAEQPLLPDGFGD